ncbi:SHOCT domain-containing protein [Natronospora cellulosivora (SeqCode)]
MSTSYQSLENLAKLKEDGVITEEEFNQRKKDILNAPVSPNELRTGSPAFGIAGFIMAIVSLILPIAILDLIIGIVALILSISGMVGNKPSKGLAIAGLVISIIAIMGNTYLIIYEPEVYSQLLLNQLFS